MSTATETIEQLANREYKYGFVTEVESETIPKGLNEDVVRLISAKKNEPEWLLEWRLKAYRMWLKMEEPRWPAVSYPPIDYQDAYYYAAPSKPAPKSLADVDPELLRTYEKLGIPLKEQAWLAGVQPEPGEERERLPIAVDAVFDSVSVATTFKE